MFPLAGIHGQGLTWGEGKAATTWQWYMRIKSEARVLLFMLSHLSCTFLLPVCHSWQAAYGNEIWSRKAYISCLDAGAADTKFIALSHNQSIRRSLKYRYFILGSRWLIGLHDQGCGSVGVRLGRWTGFKLSKMERFLNTKAEAKTKGPWMVARRGLHWRWRRGWNEDTLEKR